MGGRIRRRLHLHGPSFAFGPTKLFSSSSLPRSLSNRQWSPWRPQRRSPCRRLVGSPSPPGDVSMPSANSSSPFPREDEADFHRDPSSNSIVPFYNNPAAPASFSKDAAMGLILSAAAGRGWTTGSGMEGPPAPADSKAAEQPSLRTFPWSLYTKSPRRRMRVAFTCNVCGQRTTRAINPHAYTDGTVFVQCCGCNVFHKLVDNLKLFHEMKCYVNPSFRYNEEMPFNYLDEDDDQNIFPIL